MYMQASSLEELSVHRGEKIEVLDDSRNWWKVKNRFGATGYVASNMLEVLVKRQKNVAPSGGNSLSEKGREREGEGERKGSREGGRKRMRLISYMTHFTQGQENLMNFHGRQVPPPPSAAPPPLPSTSPGSRQGNRQVNKPSCS